MESHGRHSALLHLYVSAIDTETLYAACYRVASGVTVVAIAHRLFTVAVIVVVASTSVQRQNTVICNWPCAVSFRDFLNLRLWTCG